MEIINLGLTRYADALQIMNETHKKIVDNASHQDSLLVTQHFPVITMGNRPTEKDMFITAEALAQHGIDFVKIDRGGSVTAHEPFQIVVYPLVRVDARRMTVKKLVNALEEAMILTCKEFKITANRDPVNPGVWVGKNKIGAIGLRIENHVSKHGLALNVENNLSTFEKIIPCGILGRGVTSLKRENPSVIYNEVENALVRIVANQLNLNI